MKISNVFALISLTFCSAGSWQAPLRPHPPPACSEHIFLVSSNFPLTHLFFSSLPTTCSFFLLLCWLSMKSFAFPAVTVSPICGLESRHCSFLTPEQMEMWSTGEVWEWLVPLHSLEDPREGGSCLPHLELGSRGATAFHPSPFLEGIAAQLVHPPFLKGKGCPFLLPVSRETAAGKALEVLELAGMPSPTSHSGSSQEAGVSVPPIRGQRDPWSSSCPFVLLSITVWQFPGHRECCCEN